MKPTDAPPCPADWRTKSVSDAALIKRGVSWSKDQELSEQREDAVAVVGISNVQERLELDDLLYLSGLKPKTIEAKRVSAGWSLVVGSNGNRRRIGNAVLIDRDQDFLFASFLIAVTPKPESGITPEFFYRWLSSERVQAYITASAEGTTGLSNLSHSFFRAMQVAYPEQQEQAAIVRVLDAVDHVIEHTRVAARAARQLKESIVQTFFYSALGVTAYADRPTQKLPQGWSLLNTESVLDGEPKNGVSPQATAQGRGVPTFSIAAVRHGRVDLSTQANLKYAEVPPKVADKFRLAPGDVLVVRGNANPDLVGKAGIVSIVPHGCIYPDITKRITLRQSGENTVSPEYFVLAWNHSVVHNQVLRRAKTSNGTLKINSRDVKQIVVPVPPATRQQEIVSLVAATEKAGDALRHKISGLEQLKKSLLHDLLSGTVRLDPALFAETSA